MEKLNFPQNVAVYGTLRSGYSNHGLISRGNTDTVGSGETVNLHTLTASGIPFVKKDGGKHKVKVEVYQVNDKETMDRLDSLEGHPRWYRREQTPVELEDGSVVDAWLYFNEDEGSVVVESGDYSDYARRR